MTAATCPEKAQSDLARLDTCDLRIAAMDLQERPNLRVETLLDAIPQRDLVPSRRLHHGSFGLVTSIPSSRHRFPPMISRLMSSVISG